MDLRFRTGAMPGVAATLLMSAPMAAARWSGYVPALPPEEIVARFGWGKAKQTGEPVNQLLAAGAHLGFGAGSGMLFDALTSLMGDRDRKGWPAMGALYALGIWSSSYMGWIPALGILPPPDDDDPRRTHLMLASHLIFGLCLGAMVRLLRPRPSSPVDKSQVD